MTLKTHRISLHFLIASVLLMCCFFTKAQLLETPHYSLFQNTSLPVEPGGKTKLTAVFPSIPDSATLSVQEQSWKVEGHMVELEFQLPPPPKRGQQSPEYQLPVHLTWNKQGKSQRRTDTLFLPTRIPRKGLMFGMQKAEQVAYTHCANFIHILIDELEIETDSFYMEPNAAFRENGNMFVRNKRIPYRFFLEPEKAQKLIFEYGYYGPNGQKRPLGVDHVELKSPPKPVLEIWVGDSLWDGEPVSRGSEIKVTYAPQEAFRSAYPKDARYNMTNIEVRFAKKYPKAGGPLYLKRRKWPTDIYEIPSSEVLRLPAESGALGMGKVGYGFRLVPEEIGIKWKGTLLVLLSDVSRINYNNEEIPLNLPLYQRWLEIPIR